MSDLKVEYVQITDIKPYEKNAKLHPEEQIEQIKKSIQSFQMIDPIGTWHGEVVEGHGRLEACKRLGYTNVPVIRLDHLTDEQRKAYALAHNKLTMNSGFDLSLLAAELDELAGEIDMSQYGFDYSELDDGKEFFENKDRIGKKRQEGNDEYNEFLEKFEAKKTTDDCYTPDIVYNAVAEYVADFYNLNRADFVRPFYPNGNYQRFSYKNNSVVVDNPPFSILSEIVKYYNEQGVKYFLFAPQLTVVSYSKFCCVIPVNVDIEYENGAIVNTAFITNLESTRAKSEPQLYRILFDANAENTKDNKKELPKYEYPPYVLTAAALGIMSKYGIDYSVGVDESYFVRALAEQKEHDKTIYGAGLLISEEKAQEQAQAQAQAQAGRTMVWRLNEEEMQIVRSLGGGNNA